MIFKRNKAAIDQNQSEITKFADYKIRANAEKNEAL